MPLLAQDTAVMRVQAFAVFHPEVEVREIVLSDQHPSNPSCSVFAKHQVAAACACKRLLILALDGGPHWRAQHLFHAIQQVQRAPSASRTRSCATLRCACGVATTPCSLPSQAMTAARSSVAAAAKSCTNRCCSSCRASAADRRTG